MSEGISNLTRLVEEWDHTFKEEVDYREVDSHDYRDFLNAIEAADQLICQDGKSKMSSHNCDVSIKFSMETEDDIELFECYGIEYDQFISCGCYCSMTLKLRPVMPITEENSDV